MNLYNEYRLRRTNGNGSIILSGIPINRGLNHTVKRQLNKLFARIYHSSIIGHKFKKNQLYNKINYAKLHELPCLTPYSAPPPAHPTYSAPIYTQ
ncbi:unnamed protein product, partial [Oppiella nova]